MTELLSRLATARGAGVRVAILDSGVDADHPWIGGRLVESHAVCQFADGFHILQRRADDLMGHGTAVASQIRRFAPEAELVSVQVLGNGLRADSEALLAGLRWLVTRPIHLVNLSLSTQREQFALRMGHAIDDLSARRVACICARGYHADGRAYPTDFAGVVAVSFAEVHPARVVYRPLDPVDFDASGVNVEVAWKRTPENPQGIRAAQGSSFACPLVTGLAARLLSLKPDLTPYELKSLLKAYAERQAAGWWEPWMDDVARPPV